MWIRHQHSRPTKAGQEASTKQSASESDEVNAQSFLVDEDSTDFMNNKSVE
nr:MAG TPA: hypothetical protein [Caudoviricetes sp.]